MPNEWTKICAACAEGTPPERCVYYGEPGGCNAPKLGQHPDGNVAERLQEALDKAERRIAELDRATGNAAAMREALERSTRRLHGVVRELPLEMQKFVNADIRDNDAALAAPARNCDRFKTAVGAMEEWSKYPQSRYKGCRVCPHGDASMVSPSHLTLAEWLFAPAEGGAE